jgi:hypothetical protein
MWLLSDPGSHTKKPYSDVASNLSKAFKSASFARIKSDGDLNVALEKEGKLFVQVLYPDNDFTIGASFTTLYIKVVEYKGGKSVYAWYCNTNFFTAALKEVLNVTKGVDTGSDWLNYAMKFMVETQTRDTCYGTDVQKPRQYKWNVTHMATYIKCGYTQEETVAWVKAVAECVMTILSYYPFEEAFRGQVSPGLLTLLETDGFVKLRDIGIEIGTTKSID